MIFDLSKPLRNKKRELVKKRTQIYQYFCSYCYRELNTRNASGDVFCGSYCRGSFYDNKRYAKYD